MTNEVKKTLKQTLAGFVPLFLFIVVPIIFIAIHHTGWIFIYFAIYLLILGSYVLGDYIL